MSIERVYYCDWRECENHARTAASDLPPTSFLVVSEDADHAHFCGWDCLLKYAAEKPPAEIFAAGEL